MNRREDLNGLATALVADLTAAGKTVAAAESCTGGWLAKCITDVAGSSACFGFGVTSYSNDAKQRILGVRRGTLERHGAVSEATVLEMARGAADLSGADISVAISGIAGPDGGSEDKPVGTVWFGWSVSGAPAPLSAAHCEHFTGDRDAVRHQAVATALRGISKRLIAHG